jgi:thiol-disulfide isomerase/thioredoxin
MVPWSQIGFGVLLASCLVATARGQAPAREKNRVERLKEEYEQASDLWAEKYAAARPLSKLIERYDAWPAWSFIPRIVKIGMEEPPAPDSFEALTWFVEFSRGAGAGDALYFDEDERVMAALRAGHLANPRVVEIFRDCSYYITPGREDLLRDCIEKGGSREVRGLACYYLAEHLQNKGTLGPVLASGPPDRDEFQRHVAFRRSPAYIAYLSAIDAGHALKEAKGAYRRVIDEFGDVEAREPLPFFPAKQTLGRIAHFRLAQMESPGVGQAAPELSGPDLAGEPRKLSDFQGKVVVLHFWATWNPPSLENIARLQQLATQHAGRADFCILGVNYDAKREAAQQFVKEREVAWPSWWAAEIPAATLGRWCPGRGIPVLVVIDREGLLRYHGADDAAFEKALEMVLR